MITGLRRFLARVVVCALLLTATATARAQIGYQVTKGDEAGLAAVLVAVGVGVGFGIYFAVHHGHSLTGCAVSGSNGLQLQNDQQTYALMGNVGSIKAGDRVRVAGKKQKAVASGVHEFVVEKLARDYGACTAALAAP